MKYLIYKKEFQNFINRTIESGKNFYTNEKTNKWLLRNRLQLPTRFTNSLVNENIPQNSQKINSGISTDSNMQSNKKNTQEEIKKVIAPIKEENKVLKQEITNLKENASITQKEFERKL